MTEKEKVIESFNQCEKTNGCLECAYSRYGINCYKTLIHDTLALLKEQEAVEPKAEILNEIDRIYRCPKCHKAFFYKNQKYCDRCGQKVKWND